MCWHEVSLTVRAPLCATSKTRSKLQTKYSDDHGVFEYLERTVTDKVDAADGVRLVYDIFAGRAKHGLDLHRDGLKATL